MHDNSIIQPFFSLLIFLLILVKDCLVEHVSGLSKSLVGRESATLLPGVSEDWLSGSLSHKADGVGCIDIVQHEISNE